MHSRDPRRNAEQGNRRPAPALLLLALLITACPPQTLVVIKNEFAPSTAFVVYRAFWQAVPFNTPVAPGASSDPASTVAATDNTAYVVLAPGWDPASAAPPASFIVLESRSGFTVQLNHVLDIPVDDATFAGDCAAGSSLTQAEADFITQIVFPGVFAGLSYDAATCTTHPADDAGPP
jgi:hypothetical protein